MHCVCARVRFARHAWTWPMMPWPGGVEQDFLEVPSMMLENFMYRPSVLGRLSAHHADGRPLPAATVARLAAAKNHGVASQWTRFVGMALFDVLAHSREGPPYTLPSPSEGGGEAKPEALGSLRELWHAVMAREGQRPPVPGTFMPASWYHMVIGYDAGYYGYLWSEVFAHDLFGSFREAFDSLASDASGGDGGSGGSGDGGGGDAAGRVSFAGTRLGALGRRYRAAILEPCASKGGEEMLRDFLGREPNADAFFRDIGLEEEEGGGSGGGDE